MSERELVEELRGMIAGWREHREVDAETFVDALDDHLAMLATPLAPASMRWRGGVSWIDKKGRRWIKWEDDNAPHCLVDSDD